MAIFKKNITSKILTESSLELIRKQKKIKKILEIGCGDANITEELIKNFKNKKFFCSDISLEAVNLAKSNKNLKKCIIKRGSFFEPWKGNKFDLIICDISAISQSIARYTNWYNGIVLRSGENGLKNIDIVLKNVPKHLNPEGYVILPLISLSDIKCYKKKIKNKFSKVDILKKIEWPLPKNCKTNLKYLNQLKKKGLIDFSIKFGMCIAYSHAAICKK